MRKLILAMVLAVCATGAQASDECCGETLKGDYVEARTAAVFAGACHFGGEVTTTGREAQMAWRIADGSWKGVKLAGVTAMAAVVSDVSLHEEQGKRRSVLYISDRASKEQATALTAALKSQYAKSLGEVVAVRRVPITFERKADRFRVEAEGITKLAVDAMPDAACCKQPSQVWYKPLVTLTGQKVGYTRMSGIKEKALKTSWMKAGDNTAFYGSFTLTPAS